MTNQLILLLLSGVFFVGDNEGTPTGATDQLVCRLNLRPKISIAGDENPSQFLPGQELLPEIWLRNVSKQTVIVPFDFDIRFHIVGPNGKLIPRAGPELRPVYKAERTIAPGKEERCGYACDFRYGVLYDSVAGYAMSRPGKYSIEVALTSHKDPAAAAQLWTGTIRSAPVAITIRQVQMGRDVGGLSLGLAMHLPGKGGFPVAVLLKNSGVTPIKSTWDPNQMLHLVVTGPAGERVPDNFPIVCGSSGVTLRPGEAYCETNSLTWENLKSDKVGVHGCSLSLYVSTGKNLGEEPAEPRLLKSNSLQLTRTRGK